MHNLESILENEALKIHWDFEIQTDHLISDRQLDRVIVNNNKNKKRKKKRICRIVDFAALAVHRVKLKESEKTDKYLDFVRELKTMEHESDGDTNCNWHARYSHQRNETGIGGLGHKKTTTTLLRSARILRRVLEI